ncbi:hypothetical protein ANANG_G00231220, partial [Anguilla anguilla]
GKAHPLVRSCCEVTLDKFVSLHRHLLNIYWIGLQQSTQRNRIVFNITSVIFRVTGVHGRRVYIMQTIMLAANVWDRPVELRHTAARLPLSHLYTTGRDDRLFLVLVRALWAQEEEVKLRMVVAMQDKAVPLA